MRLLWIHLVGAALVVSPLVRAARRGPPLAPLVRVPAQVAELTAARSADDVFLTLKVPATNVGGDTPGDVGAIEIYAATAERQPELDARLPAAPWTQLIRVPVRRPVPPPPPPSASPSKPPSTPPVPPPPVEPGLDQGQQVTFRERLTPRSAGAGGRAHGAIGGGARRGAAAVAAA